MMILLSNIHTMYTHNVYTQYRYQYQYQTLVEMETKEKFKEIPAKIPNDELPQSSLLLIFETFCCIVFILTLIICIWCSGPVTNTI